MERPTRPVMPNEGLGPGAQRVMPSKLVVQLIELLRLSGSITVYIYMYSSSCFDIAIVIFVIIILILSVVVKWLTLHIMHTNLFYTDM